MTDLDLEQQLAQAIATELNARRVDVCVPRGARTGIVVSLVDPEGDRTMASDRGSAAELTADELQTDWLRCDALHLSGYSLMREPIAGAATHAAQLARAEGASVSVDLSSWTHIERFGESMRGSLAQVRPDIVFGNEREWEAIGEIETSTRVVKRGGCGISVDGQDFAAVSAEGVDSTGAGDALAAGFIIGGAQLALETAARCVAQVGAMP